MQFQVKLFVTCFNGESLFLTGLSEFADLSSCLSNQLNTKNCLYICSLNSPNDLPIKIFFYLNSQAAGKERGVGTLKNGFKTRQVPYCNGGGS